jgi:hypothetical protein
LRDDMRRQVGKAKWRYRPPAPCRGATPTNLRTLRCWIHHAESFGERARRQEQRGALLQPLMLFGH